MPRVRAGGGRRIKMGIQERRRYKREVLALYLPVFSVSTGKVLGYLGDLSEHGMMLISDHSLPSNQDSLLGIKLESAKHDLKYEDVETLHIECKAQSRWQAPIGDDLFSTGFMFLEISEGALEGINFLIKTLSQYQYAEILFYLDESLDMDTRNRVAVNLESYLGIKSVSFEIEIPHLMIVKYDKGQFDALAIQQQLLTQGIEAEIVKLR